TSFIFFIAAGVGGLWWVLSSGRPSAALTIASWFCPIAVFYTVVNIFVAKPGTQESADPVIPFFVLVGVFGFTLLAMLVPLVSDSDIALGRTTAGGEGPCSPPTGPTGVTVQPAISAYLPEPEPPRLPFQRRRFLSTGTTDPVTASTPEKTSAQAKC